MAMVANLISSLSGIHFQEILFGIGMTGALHADYVQNTLVKGNFLHILRTQVLGTRDMPQRFAFIAEINKDKWSYYLISAFLVASFILNMLANVFANEESKRGSFWNIILTVYPLTTTLYTLKDILFDDTMKLWDVKKKRQHVWFPLAMDSHKVFAKNLTRKEHKQQLHQVTQNWQEVGSKFAFLFTLILGLYYQLPNGVFFLWCFLFLFAQNYLNQLVDMALDVYFLKVYNNRFQKMFGSYKDFLVSGKSHPTLGRQYEYFTQSCRPLKRLLKKNVYDYVREKNNFSVPEAKAAMYIARGLLVYSFFFTMNMLDRSSVKGFASIMTYYIVHAVIAYRMKNEDRYMDKPLKRILMTIPEALLAGFTLYKPLMEYNLPAKN